MLIADISSDVRGLRGPTDEESGTFLVSPLSPDPPRLARLHHPGARSPTPSPLLLRRCHLGNCCRCLRRRFLGLRSVRSVGEWRRRRKPEVCQGPAPNLYRQRTARGPALALSATPCRRSAKGPAHSLFRHRSSQCPGPSLYMPRAAVPAKTSFGA